MLMVINAEILFSDPRKADGDGRSADDYRAQRNQRPLKVIKIDQ